MPQPFPRVERATDVPARGRGRLNHLPGAWPVRFRHARELEGSGKTHEAIAALEALVVEVPDEHAPRHDLAVLYRRVGRLGDALREFNEVAKRFPSDSTAANDVADLLSHLGHQSLALTVVQRAIALDRSNIAATVNLAEILRHMGDAAAARDVYAAALAMAPSEAKTHMQYGMTLVALGEWEAGWAEMEHRIAVIGTKSLFTETPETPRWAGIEPLEGKRLLIVHEQGLGDSIMCARFARALAARGAHVHLRTLEPLVDLLATAPGVAACSVDGEPLPAHDCHIPLTSLMHALKVTPDSLDGSPYLTPHGECAPSIAALLPRDGTLTVCLTWAGNPQHSNDHRRSMDGASLEPLLALPGVRFVAMQKSPPMTSVLPAALHDRIVDVGAHCHSFNDSAHALQRVDLLVTVDTSVAHLAGAIGVRTLLCLPLCPDYRWGVHGETTPWYRSVSMLRQRDTSGWESVLNDVIARIEALRDDR